MLQASFPYVTTSLEAFLLIGMSSHLSKLLIVYTEVVHIPKVQYMKQTVVSIITGKQTPVKTSFKVSLRRSEFEHHIEEYIVTNLWL